MFDTAGQHVLAPTCLADPTFGVSNQLVRVCRSLVDQDVPFEMSPSVLNRVQIWRVRRKVLELKAPVGTFHELLNLHRAMGIEPVPDDDQRAAHVTKELPQEFSAFCRVDVFFRIEPEVTTDSFLVLLPGPGADSTDDRHLRVGTAHLFQNWSSTAGSPGSAGNRSHENCTFVDKCYGCPGFSGFFLIRGQLRLSQPRTRLSSRSIARRSGFCCVQPIFLSSLTI